MSIVLRRGEMEARSDGNETASESALQEAYESGGLDAVCDYVRDCETKPDPANILRALPNSFNDREDFLRQALRGYFILHVIFSALPFFNMLFGAYMGESLARGFSSYSRQVAFLGNSDFLHPDSGRYFPSKLKTNSVYLLWFVIRLTFGVNFFVPFMCFLANTFFSDAWTFILDQKDLFDRVCRQRQRLFHSH